MTAAFATRDFDGLLGRWSFDANGDIDVRRGTRLAVRHEEFARVSSAPKASFLGTVAAGRVQ